MFDLCHTRSVRLVLPGARRRLFISIIPCDASLVAMFACGQLHVGSGPEMTQISDREVEGNSHLSRHDDKGHVPTQ